jgi:LPS O-antigen subunit length determinant protein (WzzB/FepE family)
MTIKELQERLKELIQYVSDLPLHKSLPQEFREAIKGYAQSMNDPQLRGDQLDSIEEVLVQNLINSILVASQLGIDLEDEANSILMRIEIAALPCY